MTRDELIKNLTCFIERWDYADPAERISNLQSMSNEELQNYMEETKALVAEEEKKNPIQANDLSEKRRLILFYNSGKLGAHIFALDREVQLIAALTDEQVESQLAEIMAKHKKETL